MKLKVLLMMLIITGLTGCSKADKKQAEIPVKPGQIYRKIYDEDNPYIKPWSIDYRVLEVNRGYVLYVRNETDTLSESEAGFLFGDIKLIKE